MPLNSIQRKHLRSIAHHLKPIITIGDKGLTPGLLEELDSTLTHHELIKVRIRSGTRSARDAIISDMAAKCSAELVGRIGNIASVYRARQQNPAIQLP